MSRTEGFELCPSGQLLKDADNTSLDALDAAVSFLKKNSKTPAYVRLEDYTDLMRTFINTAAAKKILEADVGQYQELLISTSSGSSSLILKQLANLQIGVGKVLELGKNLKTNSLDTILSDHEDVKKCKGAFRILLKMLEELAPVTDLDEILKNSKTKEKSASQGRIRY